MVEVIQDIEREVDDLLPADEGCDDAKRLVPHLVLLVEHEQIRAPLFRLQRLLAMLDGPCQLFAGRKYFAKAGVDACLARIETRGTDNGILIIEDVPDTGSL